MAEFRKWLAESTQEDNRRIIHDAFSRGVDKNDASVIGYHGTSIQTLRVAIERGFMPVTAGLERVMGGDHYKKSKKMYGIHLVPNPKNAKVMSITFRNERDVDPQADAILWARHTAERHVLFDLFGLNMDDLRHHRAAFDIQQGFNPHNVMKKLKAGPPNPKAIMGGVVLSISDDVADEFEISVGGDGDDLNIHTTALPIKYIRGVEPHHQSSYDWLAALGSPAS